MPVSVTLKQTLQTIFFAMIVAAGSVSDAQAQAVSAVPDVVGIRPGMSAQEAYNALKARSNGAKVGIGQMMLPAVTDRPVAVIMSVQPLDTGETITVWLTLPPTRQTVWAVLRTLRFPPGTEILKTAVLDGLHKKYGPETDPNFHFWDFDEQGGHILQSEELRKSGCVHVGLMGLSEPPDPRAPQPITPLIVPQQQVKGCNEVISIRVEFGGASNGSQEMTGLVTVTLQDTPLAHQSQTAYQAALANAGAAQHKEEIDRANQQKTPTF